MQDVGYLDLAGCMALGATGPILRSAGLPHDLRKAQPYCGYENYDFEIPTADTCDSYGRFLVRLEEMRQSLRIVEQCLDRLEPGPVMVADKKIAWPAQLALGPDGLGNSLDHIKKIMGTSMEALIHHFKLVTEGFRVPAGQAYAAVESAKGELGVHVVSDGGTRPLPRPLPRPVLHQPSDHGGDVRGRPGRRRHRRGGVHRPRDGRRRPVTNTSDQAVGLGMPQMPAPEYPADVRARLEADAKELIARYPDSRSALLPLLHLVQAEEGHVTRTGVRFCAETARPDHGRGHRGRRPSTRCTGASPRGDYQVGVCTNTLCAVMGGDAIFETLQEHLGVGNDETTEDGKVTLEHIECNAACDFAPVVMVNWEFFDNQTPAVGQAARRRPAGRPHRRADPRRPAVHLQGDRPHPGRVPRRAPRRRRGDRRRGPRLAGGPAAGQGRVPGRPGRLPEVLVRLRLRPVLREAPQLARRTAEDLGVRPRPPGRTRHRGG